MPPGPGPIAARALELFRAFVMMTWLPHRGADPRSVASPEAIAEMSAARERGAVVGRPLTFVATAARRIATRERAPKDVPGARVVAARPQSDHSSLG